MLLAVVLAGGASGAASELQDSTSVEQLSNSGPADTSPDQVPPAPSELPPQLSSSDDASPEQAQLSRVGSSSEQPKQVSTSPRSAEAPQPLSSPEDGRTAAIARVEGKDRCDAANPAQKKSDECKHVIETRAADYQRPKPAELSPEQKLLLEQQALNADTAGQRLARSGDTDNSLDAMGIAAIVLAKSQPEEPKKPVPDAQTDAAVQAIISVIAPQQ